MFKPIAQVHIYLNIFKPSDVPYTIINFSLGNLKLHTQMTSIEQPGSFYKLQFECTYPTIEDETESNEVYRRELLAIFRTSQFDDEGINDSLDKLYIALKDNVVVAPLLVLSARMAESSDPMIGLIMLHSFDYLYLTHPLLSALLVDGQIHIRQAARDYFDETATPGVDFGPVDDAQLGPRRNVGNRRRARPLKNIT